MRATLTYHSIDESGSPISVSPAAFDAHLAWLASGRTRAVSLDALIHRGDDAEDVVAVTFDDGFANIKEPVERLRAHGIPVTIFVVTAEVGRTNAWGGVTHPSVPTLPLLDWAALEHLASLGVEIAAHTRTHAPLSQLSAAAIDDELGGCREDLVRRIGATSGHMAYPYGDVDKRVAAHASVHFRSAHTTELRPLRVADHPMHLPRIDMYYFQAPSAIAHWGTRAGRARLSWIGLRRLMRHGLLGGPFPGAPRRWTR